MNYMNWALWAVTPLGFKGNKKSMVSVRVFTVKIAKFLCKSGAVFLFEGPSRPTKNNPCQSLLEWNPPAQTGSLSLRVVAQTQSVSSFTWNLYILMWELNHWQCWLAILNVDHWHLKIKQWSRWRLSSHPTQHRSSHSAKNDQRRNPTLQFSAGRGNDETNLLTLPGAWPS